MARRKKDDTLFGAINELSRVMGNNKKNGNHIEQLFTTGALIIILLWVLFKYLL